MKQRKIKKIRYHGYVGRKDDSCCCCENIIEKGKWRYKDLKLKNIFCKSCAYLIEEAIKYGMTIKFYDQTTKK